MITMTDIAIKIENLSKKYLIGAQSSQYDTFRDLLMNGLTSPFKKMRDIIRGLPTGAAGLTETIWALKDISFDVKKGEIVGIIGRNGAGKSTLLKILSRITEPTEGYADIYGRVGSLLEVGTGFHPELTGRENIYLNGSILGMKKEEIIRKFDEIIAFAEIEKFLDTPVKHFSSGMYMRLAFAVAAHLEPEILVIDEVLAVGDIEFQKKCLGKMGDVAAEGRTVLFVSHNMSQIRRLCTRGLWLKNGKCVYEGSVEDAISSYQLSFLNNNDTEADSGFISWRIVNSKHEKPHTIYDEGEVEVEIILVVDKPILNGTFALVLQPSDGNKIAGWGESGIKCDTGTYNLNCRFSTFPLRPGIYQWYVSLWDGGKKIDVNNLYPELVVSCKDHSTLKEPWAGFLNIPCSIQVYKP